MIDLGPVVVAVLALAGVVASGSRPDPDAEAAKEWLVALRKDDVPALAASTALPFTYRTNGVAKKCDVVAKGAKALWQWARCFRATNELRLADLDADWSDVRIYRGLPPAPLTHLKAGIDDDNGYWVQGFVSYDRVTIGMAFLVVEARGGTRRVQAFVVNVASHA